jgi:hypothetical protein
MRMIKTTQVPVIEIKFCKGQNPECYHPGDEVSGIVELIADKKIKDVKGTTHSKAPTFSHQFTQNFRLKINGNRNVAV